MVYRQQLAPEGLLAEEETEARWWGNHIDVDVAVDGKMDCSEVAYSQAAVD